MKKRFTFLAIVVCLLAMLFILASCGHEHSAKNEWEKNETEHWHQCSGEECTELLDKGAHDFELTTTAATCTAKGSEVQKCKSCGFEKVSEIAELGHDFQEQTEAPTCVADGKKTVTCKREGCDYKEETPITALGHDISEEIIPPTCTVEGMIIRTCNREGCDVVIPHLKGEPATGIHTPEIVVIKDATCLEDGEQKIVCTVCKGDLDNSAIADFNPVITKLGHTYEGIESVDTNEEVGIRFVPANCDTNGYVERICVRCGFDEDPITFEQLSERFAADAEFIASITKWGHKYEEKVSDTAPKCEEKGYTTYKCTNEGCESTENRDFVDALTHDWVENGTANCATEGKQPYICKREVDGVVCGATKNDGEVDPEAAKHTKGSVAVAPTCCDKAKYVCLVCETEYTAYDGDAEGAPTGVHNYDVKGESYASTCGVEGYTLYGCSAGNCGTTQKKDFVEKIAHTLGEVTLQGTVTCSVCNRSYVDISAEKIEGSDKVCFCGQDPCTCEGISGDWEGYIKPGEPERITAGEDFEKSEISIGEGLIILKATQETEFTIRVYSDDGDTEPTEYIITVTGIVVVVDLYECVSVGAVTITATNDATVSFYSVI